MKITFNDTVSALKAADDIVILTHKRPDGDTLGSAAALCLGLRQLGKRAYLFYNSDITSRFESMVSPLWQPEGFEAKYVCAVDVADRVLLCAGAPEHIDLAIDHHPSFKDFGTLGYCEAESAACGEIIYELLQALGCTFTQEMADAVYTAVSTDTGCFCFDNTTVRTHRVAMACFEAGADWRDINYRCFRQKSRARTELEGYIYSEMDITSGGRVAVAVITRDDIERIGASDDDLDNLSSLITQIKGVEVGVLLTETTKRGDFKVSMRSGKYNVSEICAIFGGGGHAGAAGCTLHDTTAARAAGIVRRAIEEKINA